MCGSRHGAVGPGGEQVGHVSDDVKRHQRLITLKVDDDLVIGKADLGDGFGKSVGARRVMGIRHDHVEACGCAGLVDGRIVHRHDDPVRAAGEGALGDSDDHWPAADVGEWLVGKARGLEARRNDPR